MHVQHAIAARRELGVVRDQNQRRAALAMAAEQKLDDLAPGRSRRDCRSARRQRGWRDWARARGRARRAAVRRRTARPDNDAAAARKPDGGKLALGACERIAHAGEFERHRDVLQRRHGRDQMEGLEHDADIAAAKTRQPSSSSLPRSCPATMTEPASGRSSPVITISSVDLPEPDGPSSATASPRPILQVDVAQDMDAGGAAAERQD